MALMGRHFEEAYKKPQLLRKEVTMYGQEALKIWSGSPKGVVMKPEVD
jgi:hypothetical protein